MAMDHPRLLLPRFLSPDLCKELEFIHRSCGTVGYRPNVFSTTLSHLVATNSGHLLLPFVPLRERIKDAVEGFFGCEFDLFIEFTGLISWCKGACIGWHSDDNRPYLKQRDFAAVCYLNSHGRDFKGGEFHFKDGEPSTVVPVAGDLLIYTADSRNIHSVEEVLDGERLTLTIWFTRNSAHDEDTKLISLLSQMLSNHEADMPTSYLPVPASDSMYWFSQGQLGFDLRCARVNILGYSFYSTNDGKYNSSSLLDDSLELLNRPLRLGRGDQIFENEFLNGLHALQVVQFYYWKAHELVRARNEEENCTSLTEPTLLANKSFLEVNLPCNHQLAKTILSDISQDDADLSFDWVDFAIAVAKWEEYTYSLRTDLLGLIPLWLSNQIMFLTVPAE